MPRPRDLRVEISDSDSETDSDSEEEITKEQIERKNYLRKLTLICKCPNPICGCITSGNTPFDCEEIICPNSYCGCDNRMCPLTLL